MAMSPSDARTLLTSLIGMGGGRAAASLAINNDKKQNKEISDRKQFRQTVNSVITEFDNKALKQLRDVIKSAMPSAKDDVKQDEPRQPSWWRKLLGPALALLGGLAALMGFFSDGPFKGLLQFLGKYGVLGGLKLMFKGFATKFGKFFTKFTDIFTKKIPKFFTKLFQGVSKVFKFAKGGFLRKMMAIIVKFGGKALKFLKPIPVLGGLISFAFAYSRFKQGDIAGGLLEIASGVASFFPGVGTAISIGIDILLAVLDYKAGGTPAGGGKGKGGILKEWALKLAEFLLRLPPFLPVYMFYKGIMSVVNGGSITDALIDMAYTIPFFGTLAGWLGAPGSAEEAKEDMGSKDGFFASIKNFIMGSYPIKNLLQFWGGIKKVWNGEYVSGLTDMAYAVPFFGSLVSFFGGPATAQEASKQISPQGGRNFFRTFRDGALRKVLGYLPKSVLGVSVRSRVAKLLGINLNEPPLSQADSASGVNDIDRGSKSISDAGKQIADASAKFGKSSPGVWEYIAKASDDLIGNVKKIINALGSLFKGILNEISPFASSSSELINSVSEAAKAAPINTRSDQQAVLIGLQEEVNRKLLPNIAEALGEDGEICKRLDTLIGQGSVNRTPPSIPGSPTPGNGPTNNFRNPIRTTPLQLDQS